MKVEIISVGDELLTGQVVDTNAAFLAKEVKKLGFNCHYKTTVGDNHKDIHEALEKAVGRVSVILLTGGLGPTEDDLTVDAISSYFKLEKVFHKNIADHIESLFRSRGMNMPDTNLKQAYVPVGAQILFNSIGTAPGIYLDVSAHLDSDDIKIIMTFPGVPYEMEKMWFESASPYLKPFLDDVIYEKYINYFGISESALIELIPDFLKSSDPMVLPYANNFQVQLRVFSKNQDSKRAQTIVENAVKGIMTLTGDFVFGFNDDTLESVIGHALRDSKQTIAIAESCTGGLISNRLTDISGSSEYIKLNMITYSNEAKINNLKVPKEIIAKYGAVSYETAHSMAQNIRQIAGTDMGVGITGIAGPTGGTPDKPVGTVYIGISYKNNITVSKFQVSPVFSRSLIKWRFSQIALDLIRKSLLKITV